MSPLPADRGSLSALVGSSVAGDRDALNQLAANLRPYVAALVRRSLGGRPPTGTDESSLVQRSMVRICERIGQLKTPDVPHLLGWVGQVVRNLVADEHRATGRRPRLAIEVSADALPAPASPHRLERDETAVRVAAAMAELPERYRAVLECRFCDDLADADTADRLGISPGAVRVLRLRALRRLRDLLGDDFT